MLLLLFLLLLPQELRVAPQGLLSRRPVQLDLGLVPFGCSVLPLCSKGGLVQCCCGKVIADSAAQVSSAPACWCPQAACSAQAVLCTALHRLSYGAEYPPVLQCSAVWPLSAAWHELFHICRPCCCMPGWLLRTCFPCDPCVCSPAHNAARAGREAERGRASSASRRRPVDDLPRWPCASQPA